MNQRRWAARRTALAVLAMLAAACGAPPPAAPPAPVEAPIAADERAALARATAIRDTLLRSAEFVDFGSPGCEAGFLRTFPADTGRAATAGKERRVSALEQTIVGWGVDEPLDTPAGRALLMTVIAWESGGRSPLWDVAAGEKPRRAIAAGLGGSFQDPSSGKCVAGITPDSTFIVVPATLAPAVTPGAHGAARVVVGDSALGHVRTTFAAAHAADTSALLAYTRIRAAVLWREWGLVAVHRPAERRGILQLGESAGGASYIFRHVNGEWRLLLIGRTW